MDEPWDRDDPIWLFKASPSKWGEGKVHYSRYNSKLNRPVAHCQKLNPILAGKDVWAGSAYKGPEAEVTCRNCLINRQKALWQPMTDAVAAELRQRFRRYDNWSLTWVAERIVKQFAEQNEVPDISKAKSLAQDYRGDFF